MNWDSFINEVFIKSEKVISEVEIKRLLEIHNVQLDNPHTQGKTLSIRRLKFNGRKNTGENIAFDKEFQSGVNVIFADNNKGKSSTFKIMKFALTGDKSSIKRDVYSWLESIALEFQLNNVSYTVYLDLSGTRLKGGLYRSKISDLKYNSIGQIEIEKILLVFEANSENKLQEKLQQFFFDQFSYYNLFWTSSNKNSLDLQNNSTSWKTYYKSIYLESKDYNVLFLTTDFGLQNRKVMEMILGLKYTGLINSWKVQLDYLKHDSKKMQLINKELLEVKDNDKEVLEEQLAKVVNEINLIKQSQKQKFNKLADLREYQGYIDNLLVLEKKLTDNTLELKNLEKEKVNLNRKIAKFEEELDFGFYFSNLEIKRCPRCEHEIRAQKLAKEKEHHKCMLCDDELDVNTEEDRAIFTSRLEEMKTQLSIVTNAIKDLENTVIEKTEERDSISKLLKEYEDNLQAWDVNEEEIGDLPDLIEKKLELEFKITNTGYDEKIQKEELDNKAKVVQAAIQVLNRKRYEESQEILISLEKLILEQINKYGLKNIQKISINNDMEINFHQNSVKNKFTDLNEGEQLRAKLAVVISLILLDVKYSVGRHPRILIIDSPGKEEVISRDLISLANIFKEINDNYHSELQIIIGTALKELKSATNSEKVFFKGAGEVVF